MTVDVTYADVTTAGGDFTHTAGQATFAAISTATQTVSVPIADDTLVEETETFTASLGTATVLGGRSVNLADTGTGTITDNDAATVSIAKTADGPETGPAERGLQGDPDPGQFDGHDAQLHGGRVGRLGERLHGPFRDGDDPRRGDDGRDQRAGARRRDGRGDGERDR